MDRKAITQRLRALASDDKKRSKAARLRDVIDEVEATLAAGISRAKVIEELANNGLEMTLATFETTLKRLRQKRGKPLFTEEKTASRSYGKPQKTAATPPVVETNNEAASPVVGSHDPAELDKIIGSKPDLNALANFAKKRKPK